MSADGFKPPASFYLRNSRASEIRRRSLQLAKALSAFLHDPEIITTESRRLDVSARIEALNGALIELNVRPSVHVGAEMHHFRSDPVMAAEYLGGQLLSVAGMALRTQTGAVLAAQEFDNIIVDDAIVTHSDSLSALTATFAAQRTSVETVMSLFDAELGRGSGLDQG